MIGRCERCGGVGEIQRHHWAPKIIFGKDDAETWPKSSLCIKCHAEWHRTMFRWATDVKEVKDGMPVPLIDARNRNDWLEPLSRLIGDQDD